jgi:DNA polymerase III sliding clamp (beta) subunit (PCNA family)
MKITIHNPREFKTKLSAAIDFTSKDDSRIALQSVRFTRHIMGSHLVMEAIDGFRMIQETLNVRFDSDDDVEFSLSASDLKMVAKTLVSVIEVDDKTVTFTTVEKAQMTFKITESHSVSFESVKPKSDPLFSILVDPKKLMSACKAFKDEDGIRLYFRNELDPILIYRGSNPEKATGCAMVLPMRP